MKRTLFILVVVLILTACSSQTNSGDANQIDSKESAEEAVTAKVEEGTTEELMIEEEQEEAAAVSGYAAVDQFYEEFISNNTSKDRFSTSEIIDTQRFATHLKT